jgi:predicted ATPase with chaperone activity
LVLSGQLRPVKGVLSIALEAKRRNRHALIVPIRNAEEAVMVDGLDVTAFIRFRTWSNSCVAKRSWNRFGRVIAGPSQPPRNWIWISLR